METRQLLLVLMLLVVVKVVLEEQERQVALAAELELLAQAVRVLPDRVITVVLVKMEEAFPGAEEVALGQLVEMHQTQALVELAVQVLLLPLQVHQ